MSEVRLEYQTKTIDFSVLDILEMSHIETTNIIRNRVREYKQLERMGHRFVDAVGAGVGGGGVKWQFGGWVRW